MNASPNMVNHALLMIENQRTTVRGNGPTPRRILIVS